MGAFPFSPAAKQIAADLDDLAADDVCRVPPGLLQELQSARRFYGPELRKLFRVTDEVILADSRGAKDVKSLARLSEAAPIPIPSS